MSVKSKRLMDLQGKTIEQKVRFYNRSAAAVFVIDTDSRSKDHGKKVRKLESARDSAFSDFPMAVGAAQPCIESWLLADASAIGRAMGMADVPTLPEEPEDLPATCRDREADPKAVLHKIIGSARAKDKHAIAREMNDIDLVRERCSLSFAPFADEVVEKVGTLF